MSERNNSRKWIIDSAPGKELIESLRDGDGQSRLAEFFNVRVAWSGGYPLIHDHFVTYGAFDDLVQVLDPDCKLTLLPTALAMTEAACDRHFHSALFLLSGLIPDDAIRARPEGLSDGLLRLRLRAEKLSFLPNLLCAWESLITKQRYLKSPGDFLAAYSPRQLAIEGGRWQHYFASPLINYAYRLFSEFPLRTDVLRSRIQRLGAKPGERRLIYATRIESSKYWVWRIPGASGSAHLYKIVFVRIAGDGKAEMGAWDLYRQFSERDTPADISRRLMEIEFYPSKLEYF